MKMPPEDWEKTFSYYQSIEKPNYKEITTTKQQTIGNCNFRKINKIREYISNIFLS